MGPEARCSTRNSGEFQPVSTNVPGTQIGEILPMCAQVADKFTILRSHSHGDNGHQTGRHQVLTGYPPNFADGQAQGEPFNILYPSLGSIVSRELGAAGDVPPYVEMPNPLGPGGPGFYGARYAPFTINNDPSQPDFRVRDLDTPPNIAPSRFERRREALRDLERVGESRHATGRAGAMAMFYEKAVALTTSPAARAAFDISAETPAVRERYGYSSIGQCSLLARRLVEAGCRFIGIDHGSWDTHFDNFTSHKKALVPPTDRAFSALLTDLDERGLLDETLVVMMGRWAAPADQQRCRARPLVDVPIGDPRRRGDQARGGRRGQRRHRELSDDQTVRDPRSVADGPASHGGGLRQGPHDALGASRSDRQRRTSDRRTVGVIGITSRGVRRRSTGFARVCGRTTDHPRWPAWRQSSPPCR